MGILLSIVILMLISISMRMFAVAAGVAVLAVLWAAPVDAQIFGNPTSIVIPTTGNSAPYPSTILVSGVPDSVSKLTVTLANLTHTFPADLDVLLVGPSGANLVIMSDVGGSANVAGVTLVLDDSAAEDLLIGGPLTSGSHKPTDVSTGDSFPNPAPQPSAATTLATFNGTNPNGIWSLYVHDDAGGDGGSFGGGWSVRFVPEPGPAAQAAIALGTLLGTLRVRGRTG